MTLVSILNDVLALAAQSLIVVPALGTAGLLAAMAMGALRQQHTLKPVRFAADISGESAQPGLLANVATEAVLVRGRMPEAANTPDLEAA